MVRKPEQDKFSAKRMSNSRSVSTSFRLITASVFLSYFLPLILNTYVDVPKVFRNAFDDREVYFLSLLAMLTVILASYLAKCVPVRLVRRNTRIKPIPTWFLIVFFGGSVLLALQNMLSGNAQWRYSTEGLSGAGGSMIIAIQQMLLRMLIFWILITDKEFFLSHGFKHLLARILLVFAVVLSINGLGSAISALFFFIVSVFPRFTLPLLFGSYSKRRDRSGSKNLFRMIFIFILAGLLATQFFQVGLVAKSGNDVSVNESWQRYTDPGYLISRHSVHMSQLSAAIKDGPEAENWKIIPATFAYRYSVLVGSRNREKPEISSFSRKALVQFLDLQKINPRGGSSPGFITTFFMLASFVPGLLLLFLYVYMISTVLFNVFYNQAPLTWPGALVFAYIPMHFLLDSPMDMLLPGPHMVVLAVLFVSAARRERTQS